METERFIKLTRKYFPKKRVAVAFVLFFGLTFFFFLFPSVQNSVSATIFKQIQANLLPSQVKVISPNPFNALGTLVGISLVLAFLVSLPINLFLLGSYFFFNALTGRERKITLAVLFSVIPLFLLGSAFAYFIFIPLIYDFVYKFVFFMAVEPFLALGNFLSFVVWTIFLFGLVFLSPVLMTGLTKLEIVEPEAWINKEVIGILLIVSFAVGGIITPDVSGVTQTIFALTLVGLYLFGGLLAKKVGS